MSGVAEAVRALRRGLPVLVYDEAGRENEVDYVVHASRVDVDVVYEMRTLAGGLICYAMPKRVADALGLPFMHELLAGIPPLRGLVKRPGYGDWPAFSLWVNHVEVATGIRDSDRALTIRELDRITGLVLEGRVEEARRKLYEEFMSPGHVPILVGRSIEERRGHTELSLYLAALAGLTPSIALAEMLRKGGALTVEEASRVSREYGYPLVTSREIVEAVMAEAARGNSYLCKTLPCPSKR